MAELTMQEYQKLAMRTDDPKKYNSAINRLLNGVMGLNGEAGEVIDLVKKALFQGHELKKEDMIQELGDVLWYIALCCETIDVSMEEVANANIVKLVKRYPDGFSNKDSIERKDTEAVDDTDGEPVMPEMRDEP